MVFTVDSSPFQNGLAPTVGPDVDALLRVHKLRSSLGLTAIFPVFFSSDGRPIWPITLYVYECGVVSPSSSSKTIQTYKENLISWLHFLETREVCLENANEEDLLTYRNEMRNSISNRTGKHLSASTINQRTASVARFYSWANAKGHFPSRLGDFVSTFGSRSNSSSATTDEGKEIVGYRLKLKTAEPFPSTIRIDQFKSLLANSRSEGEALAYRLMFATGLRRGEVCRLNIGDIPDVSNQDPNLVPLVEIEIMRKGAKRDKIKVPFALVEELNWHILTERTNVIDENFRYRSAEPLFVNKRQRRFNPDHFGANFKMTAAAAGVRCTCHSLRHTFAICVLKILQDAAKRGAEINPLKILQRLMGHAHSETTEIYLRALEIYSNEVVVALEYLYGATLTKSAGEMKLW